MNTCERCNKNPASGITPLCDDCWQEIEAEQHYAEAAEDKRLRWSENPNAVCPVCGDVYHTNIGHMCRDN